VRLYRKVGSGAWVADAYAPYVAATGYYEVSRMPSRRTYYAMYFLGDSGAGLRPSQSGYVPVSVSTIARVSTFNHRSLRKGATLKVTTRVSGPEPSTVRFRAYRWVRGTWRFYRALAPTAKKAGFPARRYSTSVKLKTRGVWRFVVWIKDENGTKWGPPSSKVRIR
jgi:hypothetical protein